MPDWNENEQELRDYGLGKLGETEGAPQWRIVRDLDGVQPRCQNCKGRIVQVRVRTRASKLVGSVGWSYYFGCPCCPWASAALLVSDRSPVPYADGLAASPWFLPDTPLAPLDPAIKALEEAEMALLTEPDPTNAAVTALEAVQAALKVLRGAP